MRVLEAICDRPQVPRLFDAAMLLGLDPSSNRSGRLTAFLQDGKTRCTTGSVVSSLYHLKDSENQNADAGFFVFPDLSVRTEGSYRLKLSLFEVVGSVIIICS